MLKSLKHIVLPVVLFSLVFTGCDSLFPEGDVEKSYDGPDVVAFRPLESNASEGTNVTIEVQYISSDGLASSDITVNIGVAGDNTDVDPDQYSGVPSSVTIASGSASTSFTVSLANTDKLAAGEEGRLDLAITGGDVSASENLDVTTIYIQGAD